MLYLPLSLRSVNFITLMLFSSCLPRFILFLPFQEQFLSDTPWQGVTSTVPAIISVTYYDDFQNTGFQWHIKFSICTSRLALNNFRLKKSNEMQRYADIYLLLNYSTCFGRPSHPSSGVQIRTYLVTFEEARSPDSMICTRGCNYSFMYSWWWARWTPETCTVI